MNRIAQKRELSRKIGSLFCAILLLPLPAIYAGGPLRVGGPGAGVAGMPLLWDNSNPITYRVDAGPLSQQPNGGAVVIDNAAGITRVNNMFKNWSSVTTANLNITNGGGLLAIASSGFPAGGDVQTAQQFLNVVGDPSVQATPDSNSCNGGGQSPYLILWEFHPRLSVSPFSARLIPPPERLIPQVRCSMEDFKTVLTMVRIILS
jgi:hypothetical protein